MRHQASLDETRYNVRVFFKDKLAVVGLAIIILTILVAVFAPVLAPYPAQGRGDSNLKDRFQAPNSHHLMGTDNQGRDILSRVIYGARIPLRDLVHRHRRHRHHRRAAGRHRRVLRRPWSTRW